MSMAGELLGEKNQEKLFNLLLKRQENQVCADCPTKAPTWVSLDFGVFVCMNCSAAHRRLSRSVTRVYSTKIDSWNKSNFQIMDHVGNEIANSYFEFKQPQRTLTINSNPDDRVRFVTDKYLRKIYANPKSQNPVLTFLSKREKGILERPYQNQENNQAVVNFVNDKEFISTNAAGSLHNDRVRKEIKEIKDTKRFNSVCAPPPKPSIDLIDFNDEPTQPQKQFTQLQQGTSNAGGQKKFDLFGDDDDNFSNFVSAPQISLPQSSKPPQPPQPQQQQQQQVYRQNQPSSNLLDLYNTPATNPATFKSTNVGYQPQQVQQPTAQIPSRNQFLSTNPSSGTQPATNLYQQQRAPSQQPQQNISQPQTQNNKSVDLMSLYSNTSTGTSTNSTTASNTSQAPNTTSAPATQFQTQAPQPQLDKNRYQALNQMSQMQNGGYYNYYQSQQGFGYGYPQQQQQQQYQQYQQQYQPHQQFQQQQQQQYYQQMPNNYQPHVQWP